MGIRTFCLVFFSAALVAAAEDSFFQPSVRSPHQGEIIYFLMPDRFNDGDPSNNTGGNSPDQSDQNGFDPSNPHFFHGGDLQGVEQKLDYLTHLGITAIWMTPVFRNRALETFGGNAPPKAGYHGYWILDFTEVDPHFGSREELGHLVESAKKDGIRTILDIVVNHTADVIQPAAGASAYQYKFSKPYLDANGTPFDDRDYIDNADFPKLDAQTSFPTPATFRNETDRSIKRPYWLNDPTLYHNRGEMATGGESTLYGELFGLDDLFTEQPRVVQGMIDIYNGWIDDFPIGGFRLDTVKHVNNEFWLKFIPAILDHAAKSGRSDFFVFGEIYDPDPAFLSEYIHRAGMPSILDFGFQRAASGFAAGTDPPGKLAEFFAKDAYYTTPTANAYGLVTFLGNHDIGRIGYFLSNDLPNANDQELLARDILAHAMMFFTRGIPALYYGDEQGFTGMGGDASAREDMFGSKVPDFARERRIGGGDGSQAAFNEQHPLFASIREMISLRRQHAALQGGVQIVRYAENHPGIFAVSRIDRDSREEILVVFNNAGEARKADIATFSSPENWQRLFASPSEGFQFGPGGDNKLSVELPPLSCLVLRNLDPIRESDHQPGTLRLEANRNSELDGRWEVKATLAPDQVASVAFAVRAKGENVYQHIGTADSPPYRVFPTRQAIPNAPALEFKAVARDLFGKESEAEFEWQRRVPKHSNQ